MQPNRFCFVVSGSKVEHSMIRTAQLAVAIAVLWLAGGGVARADLITLSEVQFQNVTGQQFSFGFSGVNSSSDGTGGTLRIGARGDFSRRASLQETLDYSAEGVVARRFIRWDITPDTTLMNRFNYNDTEFVHAISLSGAQVDRLIADGAVNIIVDFGSGTNIFNASSYASVELTFNTVNVPEPTSFVLFASAASFASRRRRR